MAGAAGGQCGCFGNTDDIDTGACEACVCVGGRGAGLLEECPPLS